MLILLCLILTFMLNGKIWPCLFRSCWTVIVPGFSRNCLDTGIIIDWVLENFQQYWKFSRIIPFFYSLFVPYFWNWMLNTAIYISFFLLFCFFFSGFVWCYTGIIQADMGIDQIWESFRQLREIFRQIRSRIMSFFYFLFVP
jgi:hypothetical protein